MVVLTCISVRVCTSSSARHPLGVRGGFVSRLDQVPLVLYVCLYLIFFMMQVTVSRRVLAFYKGTCGVLPGGREKFNRIFGGIVSSFYERKA